MCLLRMKEYFPPSILVTMYINYFRAFRLKFQSLDAQKLTKIFYNVKHNSEVEILFAMFRFSSE